MQQTLIYILRPSFAVIDLISPSLEPSPIFWDPRVFDIILCGVQAHQDGAWKIPCFTDIFSWDLPREKKRSRVNSTGTLKYFMRYVLVWMECSLVAGSQESCNLAPIKLVGYAR